MRSVVFAGLGLATLGVVIVASRSTVRGRPHASKATPAMHAAARRDAAEAFQDVVHAEPSSNELRLLLAVALHETTFGAGWRGAGAGSFNMGAIHATSAWHGDTFDASDTKPTDTGGTIAYGQAFRKYPNAVEGWKDLVRELYLNRSSVRRAAATGSALSVARAMYDTSYYQGQGATRDQRIRGYAQALADMLWEIDRNGNA